MKKLMIISLLLLVLTGCGTQSSMQPTATAMDAVSAGVQLIQQDMVLRLTQQAIESARIEAGAKMTATQQIMDATATQQAHIEDLKATQKAEAATAQAWDVTVEAGKAHDIATAQAQGTATEQALMGITATIEARATSTAEEMTRQAPFVAAQMTSVKAQSDSAQMAADRERMTNGVIAWGPWFLALVAVCAFVFVTVRKSQVGTIERDENGMMPGVVIFHQGKKQFISPDRMFSPVLTLDATGISAPQLADPDRQEGATRRAQAVEAINALPPQTQKQGMGLMAQTFNTTARPTIEVMESGQVSGWVDEAETKLGEEL